MQAKDVPDEPVLRFLAAHGGIGCTVWRDEAGEPYERSALRAMPDETPVKLARAKMGMLIRRGLVDGCTCGCRGDFELTAKGADLLSRR
jgi:hypothetical protein